ncbi:AAA-like domain-containing protein [uncultured Nostoc sp.]|uniref:AAA-like domain-containing protein n=1 Tax=uncultured Nostoc sp. TaxID=340711 RepID=UPI0035CC0E18
MVANNSDFYQIGASLSSDAPSYVQRQADDKFYQKLREGKFCYVLNSRQMGKSSLRVRTMQRLEAEGTVCAAIDLTGIGKHKVTISQWYGGIVYALVESCQLEEKFDFDWQIWWQEHQKVLDPVRCLSLFIEQVLLKKIQQPIVIFVDEIDRVLSQDFSLDDFFALIRFFQNQRVDKPIFERLTFALLGVATPSDLITDKTQTPFNIGEEIELHGFQLEEIQPLINGLQGRFDNPRRVIEEILDWTGGQPFLTQKLCKLMVDESFKENPCTVSELVRAKIIDNWESQDNPEHLRTIRNRICSDDQRASYLLELYQQVRQSGELATNNSIEVSELQLSGLVVKRLDKLRVYNQIYREIFDFNWIENQLKNLRPYSENFRFWVASGSTEDSWLMRGKALQEAKEWAKDKNLSYQDKQYLAASKEKEIQEEIAAQKQEAALSRERKDKEAAEARNQLLSEANKKAQRRISIGIVVLLLAVLGAATVGISARKQLNETKEEVEAVQQLNKLAGELQNKTNSSSEEITFDSNEALRLSALSFNVNNHQLKQALVFATKSQAYQQLKMLKEAEQEIKQSQKVLAEADQKALDSIQGLQIQVLFYKTQGDLLTQNVQNQKAKEAYSTAFNILRNHPNETYFPKDNQLLTGENVELVHRGLIKLISQNITEIKLRREVEASLTKHLYAQLEYFLKAKNWKSADRKTSQLMLNIAKRDEQGYLDYDNINNFSCPDLQKIDHLWVNADNRFGFSVQKEIWIKTGNRLGIKPEDWNNLDYKNYIQFAKAVGWYDEKGTGDNQALNERGFVSSDELYKRIKENFVGYRGSLPTIFHSTIPYILNQTQIFFSRIATCKV